MNTVVFDTAVNPLIAELANSKREPVAGIGLDAPVAGVGKSPVIATSIHLATQIPPLQCRLDCAYRGTAFPCGRLIAPVQTDTAHGSFRTDPSSVRPLPKRHISGGSFFVQDCRIHQIVDRQSGLAVEGRSEFWAH